MGFNVQAAKVHGVGLMSALLWLGGCPGGNGETNATDATATTGTTAAGTDAQPTTGASTGDGTSTSTTTTGTSTSTTTSGTSTSEASTTESTSGTTGDDVDFGCDDTTGGDPGADVCACIVDDPKGEWGTVPSDPLCGETLCPIVQAGCGVDIDCEIVVMNPEALTCALTALRDRTPGIVRWTWDDGFGQFSDDGYVLIYADGTAIRRHWGEQDLSYEVSEAQWGTLPNACAFAMCLAAGSDGVRFDCMRMFPLAAPNVVCDEGWFVDFG